MPKYVGAFYSFRHGSIFVYLRDDGNQCLAHKGTIVALT